jgi:hypothetical protein
VPRANPPADPAGGLRLGPRPPASFRKRSGGNRFRIMTT